LTDELIGSALLHYVVVRKIGEGGMGAVYLAHDPRLQRHVAIKILPTNSTPEQRERFILEARAASALNHPHIVTIHDIGREGDLHFIVMEYVEGQPLDAVIPAGGLPIADVLEYGAQIADAVATAHRAGIIHRDLKPANVIAAAGRIRVLDFGLAKLDDAKSNETRLGLTRAGAMVGTVSYMAPEQALGADVDHRADVFGFGVMLYEMLTGELPFQGATSVAVIHALHYAEPKPLSVVRPGVPAALAALVHGMLAKDPARRTPNMDVVGATLRNIAGTIDLRTPPGTAEPAAAPAAGGDRRSREADREPPSQGSERASLAVLPFASLSADKDDAYLAAGVTAELISALSGVPDLRVASHLASARFQASSVDLQDVATALRIQFVLTGSVRRSAKRIRVSAELSDARRSDILWSKTYERQIEDIFEVQEDIASQIVSAMGGELIRVGSERANRAAPESLDAWGLVRRAYHFWNHAFSPEGVEDSLNLLRRAVELDPEYAAARAFLAVYLVQRVVNFISPNPVADVGEALAAASKAIDLAPRDPEVLQNVGLVYFNSGQYENAVPALQRAVKIAPFNLVAWGYLGLAHSWTGDDEDVEEGRRILARLLHTAPDHPSVPYWQYFMSAALTRQRKFAEAAEAARQATEQQPYFYIARIAYANALGALGDTTRARVEIDRVLETNPSITPDSYVQSVYLLTRIDERAEPHLAGLRAARWVAPAT
jgi:TolB-like protein/tetratricopeptide (TPR) repeat protein/predicted Ser/Thr protein kinase